VELKFNKLDNSIEKRILTGCLVSKEFLDKVHAAVTLEYIESNQIRKIIGWTLSYYKTYDKAPGEHIVDIFKANSKRLKDEEKEMISDLIKDILTGYTEGNFNNDYVVDQAFSYFKSRELSIISSNIQYYIDKGDIADAEKEIEAYKKITKPTLEVNGFIHSEEAIWDTFGYEEDEFLSMSKDLGRFLGPFQREWLVGISAPFKKGKTWILGEFTKIAALSGLKVVSFNLEMSLRNMRKRTYMSLTGASDDFGPTLFPCFDCEKNQDNSCRLDVRTNHVRMPEYPTNKSKYKPCTACMKPNNKDFSLKVYQEIIDVPRLDYGLVKEQMEALKKIGKANIWIECMPRFSASMGDIERKLDNLEMMHNFIPDVLLIDYADILKSDDPDMKGIEKEDEIWMSLAKIASERKILVVAPTQLNKESLNAKQIKSSHTAKWVGKLGHVDAMLALNQTEAEKDIGLMRISIIEHRHKKFLETDNCYILQKYEAGQAHLDSYWPGSNSTLV